jgi:hypothetical protein
LGAAMIVLLTIFCAVMVFAAIEFLIAGIIGK